MRYDSLWPNALALSAFLLAACGDNTTTEPTQTAQPGPSTPELAVTSNSWIRRADMWSVERTNFTTATAKNASGKYIVYAIGGLDGAGGPLGKVMAYDVATNIWSLKASLPVPLYGMNQAAVLGGKIYVSGGCSSGNCSRTGPSEALYVYNPATNTWTRKAAMPAIRDSFGVDLYPGMNGGSTGEIGGQLYTLSSCSYADVPYYSACSVPLFYRYNPATDRWTTLPRPPAGTDHRYGGVIAGKFYAVGDYVRVYDPATNRWTRKARPPGPLPIGAAATVMLSRIYIVGGVWEGPLRTAVSYDPATDTWTRRADLPSARYGMAASKIFVNGMPRLEVVGGPRPGNNLQYIP